MRKVEVLPYDPVWQQKFIEEAASIQRLLGSECVEVHHIGSTAVEGLAAKPVIDIMPVVKDIQAIDKLSSEFEELGYEAKGENGISGRRYFQKGGDRRTHHVHVYEAGSPEIIRHLVFRDYLAENPAEAAAYGKLKQQLATEFPWDIERYITGKEAYVASLEKTALMKHHDQSRSGNPFFSHQYIKGQALH